MTEQPNIKREVTEYVYEHADGPYDVVHLRESPLSEKYGSAKVAEKVAQAGVFNWGINALHPWYEDEEAVQEQLELWREG